MKPIRLLGWECRAACPFGLMITAVLALLFIDSVSIASEIRNGDDVLLIGDAAKTLDEIEFAGTFQPQAETEAWTIIEGQIKALRQLLPHAADYLNSLFYKGRLTWNFVDAQLKDVTDEGPMNVIVTEQKVQIAINTGSLVQIYKAVWDKLNAKSRATVMLHEVMWVANGKQSLQSGESVRRLLAILMDKDLANYATSNLVDSLRLCFEGSPHTSAFFQLFSLEFAQRFNYKQFDPTTVYTMLGDDVLVVAKDPRAGNTSLTVLNPNPRYERIVYKQGLYVGYQGAVDVAISDLSTDLCSTLEYGDKKEWRLPSANELYKLNNLGFRLTKYFPPTRYPYQQNKDLNFRSYIDRFLFAATLGGQDIYPSTVDGSDVVVVTSEGRHLNFNDRLHEMPKSRDTGLTYFCMQ